MASQTRAESRPLVREVALPRTRTEHLSVQTSWIIFAVLVVGAIIALGPFLYMLTTALKSYGNIIANSFWPWPPFGAEPLHWENFGLAIQDVGRDRQWG